MSMASTLIKENTCFEGKTQIFEHFSNITQTLMRYAVHLPCDPKEVEHGIIWLSGLTCNEENFITKSGIQRALAGTNTLVICPDTSPRGLNLPDEHSSWDFGSGAGFYVNATTEGYADHYKMYDYVVLEIYKLLKTAYQIKNVSIMGHSMGGHGALIMGLKEPEKFRSVSAFSPIVHPTQCPWGQKAFAGYLGDDVKTWSPYDATELVKAGHTHPQPILIDQGSEDEFLAEQLLTEDFKNICQTQNQALDCQYRAGYDHSYYFIASFLQHHIDFHLQHLKA